MRALALALLLVAPAALADGETWAGEPRAATGQRVQVLANPGFKVGYSAERRQALWVAYRAMSTKGTGRLPPRPRFEADTRVADAVTHWDYKGSSYTRGHLAPNYIIGKLYGAAAQQATFLMTNIAPQTRELNELVWQRIEEAEADLVAPRAVQLWVVTGPLFGARPERTKAGVAVPEAFFRIWLDERGEAAHALAFVVPQAVCGTEPLSKFLVSVDAIEARARLDFFHELADAPEDALEGAQSTAGWSLERFESRPPRYAQKFGKLRC